MRMLGNVQAMWLMAARLTRLHEAGRLTHEMASLVKAWNTLRGREVRAVQGRLCVQACVGGGLRRVERLPGACFVGRRGAEGGLGVGCLPELLEGWACQASNPSSAALTHLLKSSRGKEHHWALTSCWCCRLWHWGVRRWAATASCTTSCAPRPLPTWRHTTRTRVSRTSRAIICSYWGSFFRTVLIV